MPLVDDNGDQLFCGRVGEDCPSGYECNIHGADRWAVCCSKTLDDLSAVIPNNQNNILEQIDTEIVNISREVTPSVVGIVTELNEIDKPNLENLPFDIPGLEEYLDNYDQTPEGLGSGFIYELNNIKYIITNQHVIDNVKNIAIILKEEESNKVSVSVLASDKETDIAVLTVDPTIIEDYPALQLELNGIMKGTWVMAVGNPLGYGDTITTGVVSGISRIVNNEFVNYIQTDAVINPGNSGGPLINLSKKVIGINTLISSVTGYWEGMGFAIPSKFAKNIIDQLIEYQEVRRGYIGVEITHIGSIDATEIYSGEFIETYCPDNYTTCKGAYVKRIFPNTPANSAGIKENDLIVGIYDPLDTSVITKIDNIQSLLLNITQKLPGDELILKIIREQFKTPFLITVILDKRPSQDIKTITIGTIEIKLIKIENGLKIVEILNTNGDKYEGTEYELKKDDVIMSVVNYGKNNLNNIEDFALLLEQIKTRGSNKIHLTVVRDKEIKTIVIALNNSRSLHNNRTIIV